MRTQRPLKGGTAPVLVHVFFGQTAALIKMPLGTQVDLGADVLDGEPVPPPQEKGAQSPFSAMSIVAKRSLISATAQH